MLLVRVLTLMGDLVWFYLGLWLLGVILAPVKFRNVLREKEKFWMLPGGLAHFVMPPIFLLRTVLPLPKSPFQFGYPLWVWVMARWVLYAALGLAATFAVALHVSGHITFLRETIGFWSPVALWASLLVFLIGTWLAFIKRVKIPVDEVVSESI